MESKTYASFWDRVLANLLTWMVLTIDISVAWFLFSSFNFADLSELFRGLLWLFVYILIRNLVLFFLVPWFVSHFGADFGKLIFNLEVINSADHKLTYKEAFFREYVGKSVSALLFGSGYFWILVDPKNQGWHDMASDTYVIIKTKTNYVFGLSLFLALLIINTSLFVYSLKTLSEKDILKPYIEKLSQSQNLKD